ncbi:MAG: hypothetical protein ING75_14785 [Rhodocyclaceae bacterium]|nr:hypothetical protein [Rhodocyclaceae bacterium]
MPDLNPIWAGHSKNFAARIRAALIAAPLVLSLVGCGAMKTEGANFALDIRVSGTDSNGAKWKATPEQVTGSDTGQQVASAFQSKVFSSDVFRWKFAIGATGIGGDFENRTGTPLCIRFDQARLSSNFRTEPVPLRVSQVIHAPHKREWFIQRRKPGEPAQFVPPKLCFTSGQPEYFSLAPDASEIFPSSKLFNVRFDGAQSGQGIGNWVKLNVPVDIDGKTEALEIVFTARDSKLTVSYH